MADATNSEGEPSDKVHVTADTPAIFKSVFGSISFLFVKKWEKNKVTKKQNAGTAGL